MQQLNAAQLQAILNETDKLIALRDHPDFQGLISFIESRIKVNTPKIDEVKETNGEAYTLARNFYVQALRDLLSEFETLDASRLKVLRELENVRMLEQ